MARTTGSVGEETAARIRAAALRLFAAQGYAAVSMRAIAEEVGLQAGALYNHFPAKQDLLFDLMDGHMRELIAAWEAESRRYREPHAALAGFVRFHIRHHIDKQDAVFVAYMELRNLEPENFRQIEALRRLYEGFLRKILRAGIASDEFAIPDIPVVTMAIIAMLTGVTTWFRRAGRLSVDAVENIYVGMVLSSVDATPLTAPADQMEEACSTPA